MARVARMGTPVERVDLYPWRTTMLARTRRSKPARHTRTHDIRRFQRPAGSPRFLFEHLEPRLLLSGDLLTFSAAHALAPVDLTVRVQEVGGVENLQLLDSATGRVVASQELTPTSAIRVTGSIFDDRLRVDGSVNRLVPISFDGGEGSDTLQGPDAAGVWRLRAGEASTLNEHITFMSVENVVGGSASDLFEIDPLIASSGAPPREDADPGLTPPADRANTRILTDNGAEGSFAGLLRSIAGGEGSDSLAGPAMDTTWRITGADEGIVAGVAFEGVEILRGAAHNQDVFRVDPQGSLSGGLEGGPAGSDAVVLDGAFTRVSHRSSGAGSGVVEREGSPLAWTGIEILTDAAQADERSFVFDDGPQAVTLSWDPVSGLMTLAGDGITPIDPFTIPSARLTIDAGGGADSIIIASLDPAFAGSLVLIGGAGDDTLQGSAYGEIYAFPGDWGADTITDLGGTDTLDFEGYQGVLRPGVRMVIGDRAGASGIVSWAGGDIESLRHGNLALDAQAKARLLEGLLALAEWGGRLGDFGLLDQPLALLAGNADVTIGAALDIAETFERLHAEMWNALGGPEITSDDLAALLQGFDPAGIRHLGNAIVGSAFTPAFAAGDTFGFTLTLSDGESIALTIPAAELGAPGGLVSLIRRLNGLLAPESGGGLVDADGSARVQALLYGERASLAGAPALDFEGSTIRRSAGSWLEDGFAAGQTLYVLGAGENDGTYTLDRISEDGGTLFLTGAVAATAHGVSPSVVGGPVRVAFEVLDPDVDWIELRASQEAITRLGFQPVRTIGIDPLEDLGKLGLRITGVSPDVVFGEDGLARLRMNLGYSAQRTTGFRVDLGEDAEGRGIRLDDGVRLDLATGMEARLALGLTLGAVPDFFLDFLDTEGAPLRLRAEVSSDAPRAADLTVGFLGAAADVTAALSAGVAVELIEGRANGLTIADLRQDVRTVVSATTAAAGNAVRMALDARVDPGLAGLEGLETAALRLDGDPFAGRGLPLGFEEAADAAAFSEWENFKRLDADSFADLLVQVRDWMAALQDSSRFTGFGLAFTSVSLSDVFHLADAFSDVLLYDGAPRLLDADNNPMFLTAQELSDQVGDLLGLTGAGLWDASTRRLALRLELSRALPGVEVPAAFDVDPGTIGSITMPGSPSLTLTGETGLSMVLGVYLGPARAEDLLTAGTTIVNGTERLADVIERRLAVTAAAPSTVTLAEGTRLTFRGAILSGNPRIAFSGRTITRSAAAEGESAGSWLQDGFVPGDRIEVTGSRSNDGAWNVESISADGATLTLAAGPALVHETATGIRISAPDTITRAEGSWIDEGFRRGQLVRVSGAGSRDGLCVVTDLGASTLSVKPAKPYEAAEEVTGASVTGGAMVRLSGNAAFEIETIWESGSRALGFAHGESGPDRIVRSDEGGSWIDDGFEPGDTVLVSGAGGDDGAYEIAGVTATDLTLRDPARLSGQTRTGVSLTRHFAVTVLAGRNASTPLVSATDDNATFPDLVADVNSSLEEAGLAGRVVAKADADRLVITAGFGFSMRSVAGTAAGELGLAAGLAADDADLVVVTTQDGARHRVALDRAETIGQVLGAIQDRTGGFITASIDPDTLAAIRLQAAAGGGFRVESVNASPAAARLGLLGAEAETNWTGPSVVIGQPIAGTMPADRLFIEDPELGGRLALAGDLHAAARAGFAQIRLDGHVDLDAGVRIVLDDPTPEADGRTRLTLNELLRGLGDIDSLVRTPGAGGALVTGVALAFDQAARSISRRDGMTWAGFTAGRSIRVEGTAANDGVYAIASISADGTALVLDPAAGPSMADETAPAACRVTQEAGRVDLGVTVEPGAGALIPATGSERLALTLFDLGDPAFVAVTRQGWDHLARFDHLEAGRIAAALDDVSAFLSDFEAFGFMSDPLPLLGVTFRDLLGRADAFAAAAQAWGESPATSLQALQASLAEAFGPLGAAVTLSLPAGSDTLRIDLEMTSVYDGHPGLEIDLGPGMGVLTGSPGLRVQGSADFHLALGIGLTGSGEVVLFEDTSIRGNLSASAEHLEFMARVGLFQMFVDPGAIHLSGTGAPQTQFRLGLDFGGVSRRPLSEVRRWTSGGDYDAELDGWLSASLHIPQPPQSTDAGSVTCEVGLSAAPDGRLSETMSGPETTFSLPEDADLLDSRLSLVESLDLFLAGLQEVLDGEVLGINLPLIGTQMAGAVRFIEDIRHDIIDPFREEARRNDTADLLSTVIWWLLGTRRAGDPDGFPYLGLLLDASGETAADIAGAIRLTSALSGPDNPFQDPAESFVQWNMKLGGTLAATSADLSFDLGIPGLGLETDGAVVFDVKWQLSVGFGLSGKEGPYIDISDPGEARITARARLGGELSGNVSLEFVHGAAGGDRIIRLAPEPDGEAGSWLEDGFRAGQTITVAGGPGGSGNRGEYRVESVTDTELILGAGESLDDEGPVTGFRVTSAFTMTGRLGFLQIEGREKAQEEGEEIKTGLEASFALDVYNRENDILALVTRDAQVQRFEIVLENDAHAETAAALLGLVKNTTYVAATRTDLKASSAPVNLGQEKVFRLLVDDTEAGSGIYKVTVGSGSASVDDLVRKINDSLFVSTVQVTPEGDLIGTARLSERLRAVKDARGFIVFTAIDASVSGIQAEAWEDSGGLADLGFHSGQKAVSDGSPLGTRLLERTGDLHTFASVNRAQVKPASGHDARFGVRINGATQMTAVDLPFASEATLPRSRNTMDNTSFDDLVADVNFALAKAGIPLKGAGNDTRMSFSELGAIGLRAAVGASAVADLALSLGVNEDLLGQMAAAFPELKSDFRMEWCLGDSIGDVIPIGDVKDGLKDGLKLVQFSDVRIDLGTFVSDFARPVLEKIQDVTRPLEPIVKFLTTPMPVLSSLGLNLTPIQLVSTLGGVDTGFVDAVVDIINLVNAIPTQSESIEITIFDAITIYDSRSSTPAGEWLTPDLSNAKADLSGSRRMTGPSQQGQIDAGGGNTGAFAKKLTRSKGFSFPVLTDPEEVFKLLLGRPATLMSYDIPRLEISFSFDRYFPIFWPLGVSIQGSLGATVDFHSIGFDTLGIQQFAAGGFRRPEVVFNGFFINDLGDSGCDEPELLLTGSLAGAAEINLFFVRGGVGGGVFADVKFDLNDPDDDGKIRAGELIGNFKTELLYGSPALAPLAIFDISGGIEARLFAYVDVIGFSFWRGFYWRHVFNKTFISATLFDFDVRFARDRQEAAVMQLGTDLGDGALRLNMGEFAGDRVLGDLEDSGEHFQVSGTGSELKVAWLDANDSLITERTYLGSFSKVVAHGGEGNDIIDVSGVADPSITFEIDGGAGDDTITTGPGKAVVRGGSGSDTIVTGAGDDQIFGGSGRDRIQAGGGNDVVFGDGGTLSADGKTATGLFDMSDGADLLLDGGDGDDILFGGGGSDQIEGGAGADTLLGDGGRVAVDPVTLRAGRVEESERDAAGGADVLRGGEGPDAVYGGQGDDGIWGGAEDDALFGGGGVDTIFGESGADRIEGGEGGDDLRGGAGADTIEGGAGIDAIHGDEGADTIRGGGDGDSLHGDAGDDEIEGQAGVDTIHGDDGADTIRGGTEGDILHGDAGSDLLQGDEGDDSLLGGAGDDTLAGDAGADILAGDAGADSIEGGAGADWMFGDAGVVAADRSSATGLAGDTDDDDVLIAGDGADLAYGGGGADRMEGGEGDDILIGDAGTMILRAGSAVTFEPGQDAPEGADTILGGAGEDLLLGGSGSDTIDGQEGDDLIFGGAARLDRSARAGDPSSPRFRALTGDRIYGDNGEVLVDETAHPDPAHAPAWGDWGIDLVEPGAIVTGVLTGVSDDDRIAGGAGSDMIFGQEGDDTILGDGSVAPGASSFPAVPDGDDYIEGNGGGDTLFGGGGQDDLIGGSSALFGLRDGHRPDGSDIIFGGAGIALERNGPGDAGPDAHALDADVILGDNGNIFRLVGAGGAFLAFNYDGGGMKVIPRAAQWLDYTPGGPDLDPAAEGNAGGADRIHGESGDDVLYGMTGDDILYGEGQDDDLIGGWGHDWISGGTGDDGILGDDGRILTSRNGTQGEPLYGIEGIALTDLDREIRTPGRAQQAIVDVAGSLRRTAVLLPFHLDPSSSPDPFFRPDHADDILYGGLGDDALHGGAGDDAISGAEALPALYAAPSNGGSTLAFGRDRAGEFAAYDEYDPLRKIDFLLNFDAQEGPVAGSRASDGDDVLFGDLGNDWLVGGSGRDHLYGGWGSDLLNADDDHDSTRSTADPRANDIPDDDPGYRDLAYGGAGRDVLIGNTAGDRLIDWVGEFNTHVVPFASNGAPTITRSLSSGLARFLYDLSASDGADPARGAAGAADPDRNGEPDGELGLIIQNDAAWKNQTGASDASWLGEIPAGRRDVLRAANFNDGSSSGFSPDSGTWAVRAGRLEVAPALLGGDAVSVFLVGEAFPGYLEFLATVNQDKPLAGYKCNAYLLFDYQNETDFKFAGIDISNNKLQMGHRTAQGWVVDAQSGVQVRPGVDYRLVLILNDTTATVNVAGIGSLTHTFAARFDADGFRHALNDGMVGVGAQNSRGIFDDVTVQVPPRGITFEYREDFTRPEPGLFTGPATGTWQSGNSTYLAVPPPDGDTGMSLLDPGADRRLEVSSRLEIETRLAVMDTGGVVFDRYSDTDFKFVALLAAADQVVIGHHTARGGWSHDAVASCRVDPAGQAMSVTLRGSQVTVSLNGQSVLAHAFNGVVVDGGVGLFTRNASSAFDSFTMRTDDPGFQPAPPLPGGGGSGTERDPVVLAALESASGSRASGPGTTAAASWAGFTGWVVDLDPAPSASHPLTWTEAMLNRSDVWASRPRVG